MGGSAAMPLPKPSKDVKVEPKGPVVTSRKANGLLIFFGLLLIAGFAYGVYYARHSGSVVVETPTSVKAKGATGATGATGQAQASGKTTTTKSAPSETLLTAVLGTAGALLLVGVLYGRISTIKLPGGVELAMTKEAEEKTVEKSAEKHPDDPAKVAKVAQKAQALLLQENAGGAILTDKQISDAVDLASKAVS
jgi:hypothetical protein